MSFVESVFRSKYGDLGNRPRAFCPFVHESNDPLPPTNDGIQYVSSFIQRAREAKTDVILVISGWDGFTTDEQSFISLLKDFKEVKITIRVYDSFKSDLPRRFWEVDAHKVSDHFEGNIMLEGDSETDHSALFAERFRAVHEKRASMEHNLQMLMRLAGRSRQDLKDECEMETKEQ